jgi:hypothetical protein
MLTTEKPGFSKARWDSGLLAIQNSLVHRVASRKNLVFGFTAFWG